MADDKEIVPVDPAERVVAVAASGKFLVALTSAGRMFVGEVGRSIGWREIEGPLADELLRHT